VSDLPQTPTAAADERNIILTGFMGTGKTTVGRLLAARLGFEFVDTDHVIEARHGPIASIFAAHGEGAFRSLERGLAQELAARRRLVISTGGRLMLDVANVASLGAEGRVVCLVATPEQILARVLGDGGGPVRPLLADGDPHQRIIELLAERKLGYGRFRQLRTDGLTPEAIADQLADMLRSERQNGWI
jgi:shikimate kinase